MDETLATIRRVCLSVDLTGAGDVSHLLWEADAQGRLGRDRWHTERTETGEIALLPPGIDEGRVLPWLIRSLLRTSRELEEGSHLRAAIHQGLTTVGSNGMGGAAIGVIERLRRIAAAEPAAFTLAISPSIFESLMELGVPRAAFRRTSAEVWLLRCGRA